MRLNMRRSVREELETRIVLDGGGLFADSTVQIADFDFGGDKIEIRSFAAQDETLYLTLQTDNREPEGSPLELWKTRGAAEDTELIQSFSDSRLRFNYESEMRVWEGDVFFIVDRWQDDALAGYVSLELWQSDGTEQGTEWVEQLVATDEAVRSYRVDMHNDDDRLIIGLSESTLGVSHGSFWTVGGSTSESTGPLFSYNTKPAITDLVEHNGKWYFGGGFSDAVFLDPELGGLFELDAVGLDYTRIRDFVGTEVNGVLPVTEIVAWNDVLLFAAQGDRATGYELWRSDGTVEGTSLVSDINPSEDQYRLSGSLPYGLTEVGDAIVFVADHPDFGTELWRSDGTTEGTSIVLDITPGEQSTDFRSGLSPSSTEQLVRAGEYVYFTQASLGMTELWRTDGTADGTFAVQTFSTQLHRLTESQSKLFFSVEDEVNGASIWVSDGTSDGTELAVNLAEVGATGLPSQLVPHGNQLVFAAARAAGDGFAMWAVDVDEPTKETLPGDVNNDGVVNFPDFLLLSARFGQQVTGGSSDADFDNDGEVTFEDFLILAQNFGRRIE